MSACTLHLRCKFSRLNINCSDSQTVSPRWKCSSSNHPPHHCPLCLWNPVPAAHGMFHRRMDFRIRTPSVYRLCSTSKNVFRAEKSVFVGDVLVRSVVTRTPSIRYKLIRPSPVLECSTPRNTASRHSVWQRILETPQPMDRGGARKFRLGARPIAQAAW